MFKFPIILGKIESKYKILELQAENEGLKDKLIEQLQIRIADLERQLELSKQSIPVPTASYTPTNDPNAKTKVTIRTISELTRFLERRSLKGVENVKKIDNPS